MIHDTSNLGPRNPVNPCSRGPDFLCCSFTATMSKAKKKGAASEASASQSVFSLECEVFASRLWTVTNGGALLLPVASAPAGKDESLGAYLGGGAPW